MYVGGRIATQAVSAGPETEHRKGHDQEREGCQRRGRGGSGGTRSHHRVSQRQTAAAPMTRHVRRQPMSTKRGAEHSHGPGNPGEGGRAEHVLGDQSGHRHRGDVPGPSDADRAK